MKTKELHVKKIENPDFSDLRFIGKNLIMCTCYGKYSKFPGRIYFGEVKQSNWGKRHLWMGGFGMMRADIEQSQLEKQIILDGEYCGHEPSYETPLTEFHTKEDRYAFYEFKEKVNIDELRDICSGKEQRLVIRELK